MFAKRGQPKKRDGSSRPSRPKFIARRKVCPFCANRSAVIDYKEAASLRRYISDRGKIEPRRRTGACARHQRVIATAIKRARVLAVVPYVARQPERFVALPPKG